MRDIEDKTPDFYNQLKSFKCEKLTKPIPKCNLDIFWEFYSILPMVKWSVSPYIICINGQNFSVDDTTITDTLGAQTLKYWL